MSSTEKNKKVLVAMSGGVDSSVAAHLLKKDGYDISGVTMCFGIPEVPDNPNAKCCGATAIDDAKKVCLDLNIPHYVLDFSKDLEDYVIKDFISEYSEGRTPNPCARCNEYLKFGKLLEYAKNLGFDYIATGHYSKISYINEETLLARPKDRAKDQTYFLACIKKSSLEHILFPLENLTKEEAREIARDIDLTVANKPQSQDICFVPKNDYRELLHQRGVAMKEGDICDIQGNVLGKHQGIVNYTLGQRGGLGIAVGRPQYIVSIDSKTNRIVIGEKSDIGSVFLKAVNFNILKNEIPKNVYAQIRYQHKQVPCTIDINNGNVNVTFSTPQESITPGQSIVFYENDIVLAGAIIN